MASFTDSVQQLTNFKPYVDQLPINAMVEVGRYKQGLYDQGVQKIQAQIENVAGMDVVRDVDKQYLQSKLNQLGGNLRKVAAGDFSNFQLVNSVGGMINQIGKDPNIQGAVSSTMRYRRGIQDMDTAKKEGKSAPSNEWDFNRQASEWLNSTDVKQGFRGGYTPYTNYKKNALDAIKALTKDETITDDAFTLDPRGNLVIADATVRKKFAGISPDKIQQALMGTLTPGDFKQMEIDGRYNYSNVDPRRFEQDINRSYNEKISFYNEQKKVLENAKSSTTSNVEKTRLNDQIASLDKVMRNISNEQRGMSEMLASGNIEAVKAQLHTNNFIDNFSKAFSYTETSQTYETNPFAQMAMQRATKEQDWKKFLLEMNWDREKFAVNYALEREKFNANNEVERQKIIQKAQELEQKAAGSVGLGGLPQGIPQADIPKYTLGKIIADREVAISNVIRSDADFITEQQKDPEWLEAQKLAWKKSPKGVDPLVAEHFNSTEEQRRLAEANRVMIEDIQNQAKSQFGTIENIIPKDPSVGYMTPNGEVLIYTPEDFVNYNENVKKYVSTGLNTGTGGKGTVNYDMERAVRELSPKEFQLFQIQSSKTNINTPGAKELLDKIQHYNKVVNRPFAETTKKINDFTTSEVARRVTIDQGMDYTFPTGTAVEKDRISSKLIQFANLAESQEGKLPYSPNFDVETARKLAIDPSSKYTLTVVEGTQYQPVMYKMTVTGDKGKHIDFKITPEQKTIMFGNQFEPSPQVQAFRPYQEQIRKMGGNTTALAPGTSNHDNAYLGKMDFPSVNIFGVVGNIQKSSSGKYSIRISAYDPVRKQWFEDISYPRNQLVREDQVVPLMAGLNDAAVFELLNERPPSAEELKIIQQASKKPL
jgi:hypothetical protein